MDRTGERKEAWLRAVSGLIGDSFDSIAASRIRGDQHPSPLPSQLLKSLSSIGGGLEIISMFIFRHTKECRKVLLEMWTFKYINTDNSPSDSNDAVLTRDITLLFRSISLLVRTLPVLSGTRHFQLVSLQHFISPWSQNVRPSDIRTFPRSPATLKSDFGMVSFEVSYLTSIPPEEVELQSLGPRPRLVSEELIDASSNGVRRVKSVLSSLAQQCLAVDDHPQGFLPLSHSLIITGDQSTHASDDEYESDFLREETAGNCLSEDAAVALFLKNCGREGGNTLFASGMKHSQREIVNSVLKSVRTKTWRA